MAFLRPALESEAAGTFFQAESEPVRGGYDYDFVEEVSGSLKCETICIKVLRDPQLTECCGQHFCGTCLQHWLKRKGKKECPHCRAENFTHILYKPAKRKIDQLKIYCINRKAGCEWVGELNTIQAHINSGSGCGYMEVCCTNSCGEKLIRKNLHCHVTQQCPQRKYKCQHCGKEDTFQTITEIHYNECPNYPPDCPNKCGTRGIKRAEMDQHRSTCPLEPVECPFREAGCQVKIVRDDFDNHVATSQQQHLLTLMGAFREAKADHRETKANLRETKMEIKADLEALKQVIATDVKILRLSTEKQQSDLALASIETQLEMESFLLTEDGPPLTIRMINFSHYRQSGKVWHSPPFYYGDGYKMQLAVYANGTGAGAGTHVSIVLLRIKGEYDDQLKWTEDWDDYKMNIKIVTQTSTQKLQASADFSHRIYRPSCVIGAENMREEGREEMFWDTQTMRQEMLLNDSILLQVFLVQSHEIYRPQRNYRRRLPSSTTSAPSLCYHRVAAQNH